MIISHVVAMSNNNVIGVDNNLPWNLKTDLAHFKEYTSNKIIIMGRKAAAIRFPPKSALQLRCL